MHAFANNTNHTRHAVYADGDGDGGGDGDGDGDGDGENFASMSTNQPLGVNRRREDGDTFIAPNYHWALHRLRRHGDGDGDGRGDGRHSVLASLLHELRVKRANNAPGPVSFSLLVRKRRSRNPLDMNIGT